MSKKRVRFGMLMTSLLVMMLCATASAISPMGTSGMVDVFLPHSYGGWGILQWQQYDTAGVDQGIQTLLVSGTDDVGVIDAIEAFGFDGSTVNVAYIIANSGWCDLRMQVFNNDGSKNGGCVFLESDSADGYRKHYTGLDVIPATGSQYYMILTGLNSAGNSAIYLSFYDGTTRQWQSIIKEYSSNVGLNGVAANDCDGDGNIDIFVCRSVGVDVIVDRLEYDVLGGSVITDTPSYIVRTVWGELTAGGLEIANVDADAADELLVVVRGPANGYESFVAKYQSDGAGNFTDDGVLFGLTFGFYRQGISVLSDPAVYSVASAPVFSPAGPYITEPTAVTISCASPIADIYYTTDGSTPTTASSLYSSAITVYNRTTLKAIAVENGGSSSVTSTTFGWVDLFVSHTGGGWGCLDWKKFDLNGAYQSELRVLQAGIDDVGGIEAVEAYDYNGTTVSVAYLVSNSGWSDIRTMPFNLDDASYPYFPTYLENDSQDGYRKYYSGMSIVPTQSGSKWYMILTGLNAEGNSAIFLSEYDGNNRLSQSVIKEYASNVGLNGVAVTDWDADGNPDVFVCRNIGTDAVIDRIEYDVLGGDILTETDSYITAPLWDDMLALALEVANVDADGSQELLLVSGQLSYGYYSKIDKFQADGVGGYVSEGQLIGMTNGYHWVGVTVAADTPVYSVVAPTAFSPAGPEITGPTAVTITCPDAGADIYYTTDGTVPTTSSLLYTAAVTVDNNTTLKAIAVNGGTVSAVTTQTYLYPSADAPEFAPLAKYIVGPTDITITTATAGATIHYTTDGTTPSEASAAYSSPVTVDIGTVLQAIAVPAAGTAFNNSDVAMVQYAKKYFRLGWYAMHYTDWNPALQTTPLEESATHGFDYVMPYYCWDAGVTAVSDYMDAAQALGVKVVIHLYPVDSTDLANKINGVKDHPALYGYYLADEPEVTDIDAAPLVAYYNQIKEIDDNPEHPVIIAFYKELSEVTDYLPATDIAMRELYTVSRISQVQSDMLVAASAGKEYIALPGAYQNESHSMPSASEMRYMILGAVAGGADGIMPFIFEGNCTFEASYSPADGWRDQIVYPSSDLLASIVPVLEKGSNGLGATSIAGSAGSISWTFKGDSEEAVLIATNNNTSSASGTIDFTLTGLDPTITSGTVMGESRTVSLDAAGTFTDTFDAMGVHVYHFVKTTAAIPGDANGDGAVDVGDLGILAANYGTASGATWSLGDFNGDGAVDVGDLGILAANYGTGTSSSSDFDADYAKVFGEADADEEVSSDTLCPVLGLPLIAGLLLVGLMLVKLED